MYKIYALRVVPSTTSCCVVTLIVMHLLRPALLMRLLFLDLLKYLARAGVGLARTHRREYLGAVMAHVPGSSALGSALILRFVGAIRSEPERIPVEAARFTAGPATT